MTLKWIIILWNKEGHPKIYSEVSRVSLKVAWVRTPSGAEFPFSSEYDQNISFKYNFWTFLFKLMHMVIVATCIYKRKLDSWHMIIIFRWKRIFPLGGFEPTPLWVKRSVLQYKFSDDPLYFKVKLSRIHFSMQVGKAVM